MTRRILFQYVVSLLFYVVGLILAIVAAWALCSQIIWYPGDPLWELLSRIKDNIWVVGGVLCFAGGIMISRYFIVKLMHYLNEVIVASEQLAMLTEAPIMLSSAMKNVQDEMNRVREQAIRNAMLAKEAEQRKNDLIVYLAHDLKTPLTSVIGYLTLLRDEPQISQELRAKYTGIVLNKAERLEDLINEFFDITRFNLTAMELETEQMNLSRMLEQITSEFLPILAEKELHWAIDILPDIEIICDSDKMGRVFDNLIRNAVNYSYPNTDIRLALYKREEWVEIQICNRGKTISEEKLNRIFEQFFRLDSSRSSATGGAGLGLAISKEIVEAHGGSITAKSSKECMIITVQLPKP